MRRYRRVPLEGDAAAVQTQAHFAASSVPTPKAVVVSDNNDRTPGHTGLTVTVARSPAAHAEPPPPSHR